MVSYQTKISRLSEDAVRLQFTGLSEDGVHLTNGDFYALLGSDDSFIKTLSQALADMPFAGFCWETPPLTVQAVSDAFECVVVNSPALTRRPADPGPFSDAFHESAGAGATSFENLGGDARLVAPCPVSPDADYAHLACFLRTAPDGQVAQTWRTLALATQERLSHDGRIWVSTAGLGVAWLHFRLDERPKYYRHSPYRAERHHGE